MRLSQLFTGETRTEDAGRPLSAREQTASTAALNRQIRALVPGQTIHGEIVGRNGSEVQIKVSDDMILQARVDRNLNLEIGRNMTFEVRNNGSALTLSPLFTNVSTDVTVMKAIDMAGLPVNDTTVSLTSQLMQAGLSVNKNILNQVYRQVMSFPEAEVSDVVNLRKLGIPVNEANISQMISYRNLTHQLSGGMEAVFQALPKALEDMLAQGDIKGAVDVYQELFALLGGGENAREEQAGIQGILQQGENAGEGAGQMASIVFTETAAGMEGDLAEALAGNGIDGEAGEAVAAGQNAAGHSGNLQGMSESQGAATDVISWGNLAEASRAELTEQLLLVLGQTDLSSQDMAGLAEQIRLFGQGALSAESFFEMTGKLLQSAGNAGARELLQNLFTGGTFQNLMADRMKDLWTLKPEDLASPGKVQELYRRLDRQLKDLSQALESGGQENSTAYRAVTNLSQNVDFLNQVNQMYAYVQLPLRLRGGETCGELYVYTNKKNLAAQDGKVSALLHLDMEHLGPLDVYVALESSKVNTKFYLQNEEMLDFLGAHMDILTERLKKRGYDCAFSMTTRGEETSEGERSGLAPLLQQGSGMMLSRQAFDVRT